MSPRAGDGLYGWIEDRGGSLRVRWYVFSGERMKWVKKSRTFKTLREAQRFRATLADAADDGKFGVLPPGGQAYEVVTRSVAKKREVLRKTVPAFLEDYKQYLLTTKKKSHHRTLEEVEKREAFRGDWRICEKFWETVKVGVVNELGFLHVQEFVRKRQRDRIRFVDGVDAKGKKVYGHRPVEPATINRNLATIRVMLKYAVRTGCLETDPAAEFPDLDVDSDRDVVVFPDLATIDRIALAMDDFEPGLNSRYKRMERLYDMLPVWWVCLSTGVRLETAFRFRKDWVHKEKSLVRVHELKNKRKHLIVKTREDFQDYALALCEAPGNRTEFLCVDREGEPWTSSKWRARIDALRARLLAEEREEGFAGVRVDPALVNAGVCRHTFGTCWAKAQGAPMAQALMGHSSHDVTIDNYVNAFIDYVKLWDEQLPYGPRRTHGGIVGGIEMDNHEYQCISINDFKAAKREAWA